jgi:hypothetical protein
MKLPNWLRWVFVIPAAILASLAVQMIIAVLSLPLPAVLVQLWNSWTGTIGLVVAGAMTAPAHRFVVALVLTVLNAVWLTVIVMLSAISEQPTLPLWWLIVCSMIGAVSSVLVCVFFKETDSTHA